MKSPIMVPPSSFGKGMQHKHLITSYLLTIVAFNIGNNLQISEMSHSSINRRKTTCLRTKGTWSLTQIQRLKLRSSTSSAPSEGVSQD